jgi:hypothetical protein
LAGAHEVAVAGVRGFPYLERVPTPKSSRPAFFLTAVFTAGTFGGCSASSAVTTIESLRAAPVDPSRFLASIPFAADRSIVAEALANVEVARRAAQAVLFPLAAANAVVGAALLVFAWGLLSRREGARTMTLQLLVAQMVLETLEYVLTPHLRGQVLALASAYLDSQVRGAEAAVSPGVVEVLRAVVLRAPLVALAAGLLGRIFTIVPLARPATRAYCVAGDASNDGDGGALG